MQILMKRTITIHFRFVALNEYVSTSLFSDLLSLNSIRYFLFDS